MVSQVSGELLRTLDTALGRKAEVLAVGTSDDATVVALRTALALHYEDRWQIWGWEKVATGSWRAEATTFTWDTTDGGSFKVKLEEVGRLPEVFRERVQASTVLSESHDLEPGRIEIIGRRPLDGSDRTSWYVTAGGGADLNDPATAAFVVERTDALKAEYGLH